MTRLLQHVVQFVELETEAIYHIWHNLPTFKITSYSQRAPGVRQKHGSLTHFHYT